MKTLFYKNKAAAALSRVLMFCMEVMPSGSVLINFLRNFHQEVIVLKLFNFINLTEDLKHKTESQICFLKEAAGQKD